MLFRFKREGSDDGYSTIVDLPSKKAILNHINAEYRGIAEFTDIKIDFMIYDDRIPANVHKVTGKYKGSPHNRYIHVGYVDDMDFGSIN